MTNNPDGLSDARALKPCPFCGGEADYQWHTGEPWIECGKCGAVGPNDKDTTGVQNAEAWNSRTPPASTFFAIVAGEKLGWDEDGMCDDHYRLACPKCAIAAAPKAASEQHPDYLRGIADASRVAEEAVFRAFGREPDGTPLATFALQMAERVITPKAASEDLHPGSYAASSDEVRERAMLLAEVELHLQQCRTFITTREKMHPCGVDLHDELLTKVTAALDVVGRENANG